MPDQPMLAFHDGQHMPQLGFGLWQLPADRTADLVCAAIRTGYRLLDGAAIYGNEAGLGEGIRRSGLSRDDLFVTTKVWNDRQGFDSTLRAVEESLGRIGTDRLDLCLIHWPCPARGLFVDTWKALIRLRGEGRVRSIGVSNFDAGQIGRLEAETGVRPVLNQIEINPTLQQPALRAWLGGQGIVTQSWTPLGQSRSFDAPVVQAIARRLRRSPAQVILRWHLQAGLSVIPRSSNPARMAENFDLFGFALTAADMAAIATLDEARRCGPDPMTFG